ncbi:MAG: ATP-binding protein, partial [Myxococcota bacterium]
STVVTAPFLLEMSSKDWTAKIKNRCEWVGCEPVYVWMDCDIDTMRAHIETRGAARDAWKLQNWNAYEKSIDVGMRPCVAHTVVDNRANAALSLATQATALSDRMER